MKKVLLIFLFILICVMPGISKQDIKYYRLNNVINLKGKILDIKAEKSYRRHKFINIYLQGEQKKVIYKVELSPDWFYDMKLKKGSRVEITGSLNRSGKKDLIIARKVIFQKKIFYFRDKDGFPLWRGKRRQYNKSRKSGMRRKGWR